MPTGGEPGGVKKKIGVQTRSNVKKARRRQREAINTGDVVDNDPFCFINYLGKYECRLCGTRHGDKESYCTHMNGKRHQYFLARTLSKNQNTQGTDGASVAEKSSRVLPGISKVSMRKRETPKWHVDEVIHPETGRHGYCISLLCPNMKVGVPRFRILSTYDQCIEPVSSENQYIVVSCHPYRSIGVCIANRPVDMDTVYESFNNLSGAYVLQLFHT